MKVGHVVALCAFCFGLGLCSGLMLVKVRSAAIKGHTPSSPTENAHSVREVGTPGHSGESLNSLNTAIGGSTGDMPGKIKRTKKEMADFAAEVYSVIRRRAAGLPDPDPQRAREVLQQMFELDSTAAEYFLSEYEQSKDTKDYEVSHPAIVPILLCGGQDVALWLARIISNPLDHTGHRNEILTSLSGVHGRRLPMDRVPITPELAACADRLATSDVTLERCAAAGILGARGGTESKVRLMELANSDTDFRVQAAAVLALSKSEDQDVVSFLRSINVDSKPIAGPLDVEGRDYLSKTLTEVLKFIEGKGGKKQ